jgi:hypothetical protein
VLVIGGISMETTKEFESLGKMWEYVRANYKYEPKVLPNHYAILGVDEAEAKKATHSVDAEGFLERFDSDVYEDVWFEAREKVHVKETSTAYVIYMRHKVFNGPVEDERTIKKEKKKERK